MNDSASILVIVLSIILICFFIAAIILMVALIKVTKQLQAIADDVEFTTSRIRRFTENLAKFTSPWFIGKSIMSLFGLKRKGK